MFSKEDRIIRAERARQLLDDPIFKSALAQVEADAYEHLLSAKSDEDRRRLIDRINATRALTDQIRKAIIDGKQAALPRHGIA